MARFAKSDGLKENGYVFGLDDQLTDIEHKIWVSDWETDVTRFVLCHADQDQAFVTSGGLKVPVGKLF